jgi:hypothetical protein
MCQHSQYSNQDIRWKIWGSKLGRSKRTTSSPKHPDQLQHPHNIQTSSSTHTTSNSMEKRAFSLVVKCPVQTVCPLTSSRAKFKNQWSYTSTQSVPLHGTYWYNLILPLPPTYVYISQEVTSFLVL